MFGLTVEKLLIVALVAAVLVGPSRLPHHARELARIVRSFRVYLEAARAQAERDLGVSLTPAEWDVRQYDPRQMVRDAMRAPTHPHNPAADAQAWEEALEQARSVRPGQKHLVVGTAGHPRRIVIASLTPDDPRRIAAEPVDAEAQDVVS